MHDVTNVILNWIFGSPIMCQLWNKICTLHNLQWTTLQSYAKQRFASIVFRIDDILKYFHLTSQLVMECEKLKIILTFLQINGQVTLNNLIYSNNNKQIKASSRSNMFTKEHRTTATTKARICDNV